MEIKIGIGLDNLIFGMSRDDVKNILGLPNKVTDELDFAIVYYYNDEMIKAKFDIRENVKLYSFEIHNPDVLMFNLKIIGKSKLEIETILKKQGLTNFEYEDYETFDTLFCEQIWTTFRFEFNKLKDIEFSPLYKNDDIIWPIRHLRILE